MHFSAHDIIVIFQFLIIIKVLFLQRLLCREASGHKWRCSSRSTLRNPYMRLDFYPYILNEANFKGYLLIERFCMKTAQTMFRRRVCSRSICKPTSPASS